MGSASTGARASPPALIAKREKVFSAAGIADFRTWKYCLDCVFPYPRPSVQISGLSLSMTFFDYFQIAAVAIVLCVIGSKAIYLRVVTGVNPIVIGRGKGAWRVVEILSLGTLVLWMVEVVLHALYSQFDIFPQPLGFAFLSTAPVRILGVILVSFGLITLVLAFFSFGDSWRIGIDRKTPGALVTRGIFSVTRNPIYVAFNLLFIGIFLINGTWFFLIFALMAAVAVHFQILREEEYLRTQYGEAFRDYCKRTARYLIW
jgi:protein-S-isoprenylcysteine O-methyltransferase Ste14